MWARFLLFLPIVFGPCCIGAQESQAQVKQAAEPITLVEARSQIWSGFVGERLIGDGKVLMDITARPVFSSVASQILLTLSDGYEVTEVLGNAIPSLRDAPIHETNLPDGSIELSLDSNLPPGTYQITVKAVKKGVTRPAIKRLDVTIGKPEPPGPTPTPDGQNPFGMPGFRVMIVYESRMGVPKSISPAVRNYLDTKCIKDAATGIPQRLTVDQNASFGPGTDVWQAAMKRGQKSIPWIVIGNEATGYEGPLPADENALLELLKKYGG